MKNFFTLLIFLALVFFGCNQEADISSPLEINNHSYNLIKLPPKKAGLSVETIFSVTETIDSEHGGELKIKEEYTATNGETVKIDVKLKIKKNSFPGTKDITMTIDDEFAAVSFSPSMVFSEPAELKVKFEGIDLENLNLTSGTYDFVFIDDNGNIELVGYNNLHVDESKGKIWVNQADINHFSRYGFVN